MSTREKYPPLLVHEEGDLVWHVPLNVASDYNTLCGMDVIDPAYDVHVVEKKPSKRQKYTCAQCRRVVEKVLASGVTLKDFK